MWRWRNWCWRRSGWKLPDRDPLSGSFFRVEWGEAPGSEAFSHVEFRPFAGVPLVAGRPSRLRRLAGEAVLTRAFTGDEALANWARSGGARDLLVTILKPDGKAVTRILLGGATPQGWSPSALDALSAAVLTESLTVSVSALSFPK